MNLGTQGKTVGQKKTHKKQEFHQSATLRDANKMCPSDYFRNLLQTNHT